MDIDPEREENMKVIAGLGNPDKKYEHTRHNIGFDVIDALADRLGVSIKEKKFNGLLGEGRIGSEKVILVKPMTYMNNSGECIGPLLNFYKLDPNEDLIVIFDDISLEPGNLRIRKKGSAGGHNGIKSVIAHTGTEGFSRIKVGVGAKPAFMDLADWVLGRMSSDDRRYAEAAIDDATEAAQMMVAGETDKAMNKYN